MALSEDLSRLSVRASEAETRVAAAKAEARERLEHDVEDARRRTHETADRMRQRTDQVKQQADLRVGDFQRSWNEHIERAHTRIDARKAQHDASVAEHDAEAAATYAEFGPRGRGSSVVATMRKTGVQEGAFDVEDLSTAFLRLDGGGTLLLESSWAQWIPKDRCYVTVYGADGGANIEWGAPNDPDRTLEIWTEAAGLPATLHPVVPADGNHQACVFDFVDKVRSGDYTNHRGRQALARAAVVDACYASAEKGSEVSL